MPANQGSQDGQGTKVPGQCDHQVPCTTFLIEHRNRDTTREPGGFVPEKSCAVHSSEPIPREERWFFPPPQIIVRNLLLGLSIPGRRCFLRSPEPMFAKDAGQPQYLGDCFAWVIQKRYLDQLRAATIPSPGQTVWPCSAHPARAPLPSR